VLRTAYKLAAVSGVDRKTIRDYLRGTTHPTPEARSKLG
jgi:hypothetical protein